MGSRLTGVEPAEAEIDDLEFDIDDEERRHPGTRQRIEQLGEVYRATVLLWQARQRLDLTIEDVVARSGLTPAQVESVEDGAVDVPFDVLTRYGRVVGLEFDLRPVSAA